MYVVVISYNMSLADLWDFGSGTKGGQLLFHLRVGLDIQANLDSQPANIRFFEIINRTSDSVPG